MEKNKECFRCHKEVIRKYVFSKKDYSLKNNWHYWTGKEENQGKYICNSCLLDLYYNHKKEYLEEVDNKRRRRILTSYIYSKTIS
jgi:hypothetical protein